MCNLMQALEAGEEAMAREMGRTAALVATSRNHRRITAAADDGTRADDVWPLCRGCGGKHEDTLVIHHEDEIHRGAATYAENPCNTPPRPRSLP